MCDTNQQVWGVPGSGGVVCDGTFNYNVIDWQGRALASSSTCSAFQPVLSPDGTRWAGRPATGGGSQCQNTAEDLTLYATSGASGSTGFAGYAWGWLDTTHLVVNQASQVEATTKPFHILAVDGGTDIPTQLVERFVGCIAGGL